MRQYSKVPLRKIRRTAVGRKGDAPNVPKGRNDCENRPDLNGFTALALRTNSSPSKDTNQQEKYRRICHRAKAYGESVKPAAISKTHKNIRDSAFCD